MGAVHYATNSRLTACGLSTDFAIHTHEPQTVTRWNQCLVAAGEMEGCAGGCGDAHECGCFGSGWAAGKDKAHLGDTNHPGAQPRRRLRLRAVHHGADQRRGAGQRPAPGVAVGAVVCCPQCGHVHQVILSDAEYAVRFPGNAAAGQPAPAAPAPAGQPPRRPQQRHSQPVAPLCPVCGEPVGLKRDGLHSPRASNIGRRALTRPIPQAAGTTTPAALCYRATWSTHASPDASPGLVRANTSYVNPTGPAPLRGRLSPADGRLRPKPNIISERHPY